MPPNDPNNVQFMLGQITERLDAHAETHKTLTTTIAAQSEKLDKVVGYIEREKGARRATGLIASFLGAVAGLATGWISSRH
jgi:hypothetical protein